MPDLGNIEKNLGYKFNNISYLKNALTHTSYLNEHKDVRSSNERMEFLGDSVLGLSVSEFLYKNYKSLPEGVLSKIRASVVCETSLAKLASKLKLGDYLYMGKGELMSGGNLKPSLTSDAMESVIAAIYLDGGFEIVKKMILDWLQDDIIEAAEHRGRETDYKSVLQEYCQSRGFVPEYILTGESGPDHAKVFTSKVTVANGKACEGTGSNKKKAQQDAARKMLELLKVEL
ncbi:MAG: ribonuclease III [Clostridia bacterium]|nr:ribonuclease III [Clostridia bacterium]